MLTIYTRVSTSRHYVKALLWKGDAADGVIRARHNAIQTDLGRVVAAYVLYGYGYCVGVWNEHDGFRRHHPITECVWTITLSGIDALETMNDFA